MAENYEGFYDGGVSALSPEYGNSTGFHMNATQLGFPGSPQTANQLQDTVNAIKHGTKVFEVTMLQPDVAETIPKQDFEEMRALMKLTGVKPSVHGPLLDPAGFGEKGWTPNGREDNERRMFNTIEQAQVLDPSGNLPIVFHSTNGSPGAEWRPGNEEIGEKKIVMDKAIAINQETWQMQEVKREYKFRPEHPEALEKGGVYEIVNGKRVFKEVKGREHGVLFDAEGSVEAMNDSDWENKLFEVAQMNKHAEEIMGGAGITLAKYDNAAISSDGKRIAEYDKSGRIIGEMAGFDETKGESMAYNKLRRSELFVENAELAFVGAFNQAYKYGDEDQQKELKKLSEKYSEELEEAYKYKAMRGERGINILAPVKKYELLEKSIVDLQNITEGNSPGVFKLSEDFAMDKAAKTFGNLAAKSYDKFGEKAPILAIENMFSGMAFSRAEDMKALVNESRENFVEHLVDKGISKLRAKKLAEDKLGVTWDVGHLNIMKKKGFSDKDVVEQTKVISEDKSMVKHVHLTDNFGYADTHLVPGMGNVPFKAILEELEKTGRFGEMKKITEAGGFIQHFKKLPHSMTLAAMGSGIYGMKGSPTWGQAMNIQGNYFGGYGTLNPQIHHSYFGAGFTTMPVELGGQMAGDQSRFGGAPMA